MRLVSTVLAIAFGSLVSATASALPPQRVPTLAGIYVYSWQRSCANSLSWQVSALAHFHPHKGTVTINGFMTLPGGLSNPLNETVSYSNTATTITVGGKTYKVFYGMLSGRIATYLSYLNMVTGHGGFCPEQATLSRRTK